MLDDLELEFIHTRGGGLVDVYKKDGRWAYVIAGQYEGHHRDVCINEPKDEDGWTATLMKHGPDHHWDGPEVIGIGEGLSYEAVELVAYAFISVHERNFIFHRGVPLVSLETLDPLRCVSTIERADTIRAVTFYQQGEGWAMRSSTSHWNSEIEFYFLDTEAGRVVPKQGGLPYNEIRLLGLDWLVGI